MTAVVDDGRDSVLLHIIEYEVGGGVEDLDLACTLREECLHRIVRRECDEVEGRVPCWIYSTAYGAVCLEVDLGDFVVVNDDGTAEILPHVEEHARGGVVLV